MDRKQFLKLSGLAGCGGAFAGCEGLSELEKKPEGAGIQVISGVVFLAKYKATGRQREEARRKGARIYAKQGLKPAAEAKIRAIQSSVGSGRRRPGGGGGGSDDNIRLVDQPPEKIQKEKAAAAASYYAFVRKNVGGVPGDLRLNNAPIVDVPPDPKVTRDLHAAVARRRTVEKQLAIRVTGSGHPAEVQNPGAVTVVKYDTRSQNAASNAYVLKSAPRGGSSLKLDGATASYVN